MLESNKTVLMISSTMGSVVGVLCNRSMKKKKVSNVDTFDNQASESTTSLEHGVNLHPPAERMQRVKSWPVK
jgi:hypothetical protein